MTPKVRRAVLPGLLLLGLFPDDGTADKALLGWNQTAGTNTAYLADPYWQVLDEYSPHWLNISCENDTLFNLVARPGHTMTGMRSFADAAEGLYPEKNVVPMLQLQGQSQIDSLLKRQWRRARIIDQIQAVVDTLHFDGINIDFEYPSVAMRDSFSAFMAGLMDSVAGHVSCAVAPVVRSTYSARFAHGVLSDGVHGDLVLQMVYDMYGSWSPQTGPTSPLWWWKENADTTKVRYETALTRHALAGPTYGLD